MTLTVRPADGLIHRLLQQNSQASGKSQEAKTAPSRVADHVNISQQARHQADAAPVLEGNQRQNQSKLESQLLRLYAGHSLTGDKA